MRKSFEKHSLKILTSLCSIDNSLQLLSTHFSIMHFGATGIDISFLQVRFMFLRIEVIFIFNGVLSPSLFISLIWKKKDKRYNKTRRGSDIKEHMKRSTVKLLKAESKFNE